MVMRWMIAPETILPFTRSLLYLRQPKIGLLALGFRLRAEPQDGHAVHGNAAMPEIIIETANAFGKSRALSRVWRVTGKQEGAPFLVKSCLATILPRPVKAATIAQRVPS